jgi:hypothetical protein
MREWVSEWVSEWATQASQVWEYRRGKEWGYGSMGVWEGKEWQYGSMGGAGMGVWEYGSMGRASGLHLDVVEVKQSPITLHEIVCPVPIENA